MAAATSSLFRRVVVGTSYYSIAAVVQRSTSILMLPLYTRYLTRADYGVIELLDLVWTLAALLVSVQLSTALIYYYHHAETETEQRRDVVTAFFGTVLLGVCIGASGVVFAPSISRLVFNTTAYEGLVRVVLIGLGFNLPAEFGFSCLRLEDRAKTFMSFTIGRVLANISINVLFLTVLGLGVSTLPWSSLITTGVLAFVFAGMILIKNPPSLFDASALRKMMLYGLPLGISTAGEVVLHFGDRLFLSKSVSLADLGLYGLAYKLGMVVPFATLPFFNYWNSQMMGILRRPRGEETYARIATYLLLLQTMVVLLLTVFIDPLLAILVDPSFQKAARFVPWIAAAYLVRGMGSYWANTFLIANRPALVAQVTWVGAGACLLAYAVLIPQFGLWGAVSATILGFALMASFSLWKSQEIRPFRYEYRRWGKILTCGLLAASPCVVLRPIGFWSQAGVGLTCSCLFPALLWVAKFPNEGEIQALDDGLRTLLGRPSVASKPTSPSASPLN